MPPIAARARGRAYVRFTVADKVGVLAEIAAAMRDAGVSIESLIQRGVNGPTAACSSRSSRMKAPSAASPRR
jgi:glycine cleavage system regulatory protein